MSDHFYEEQPLARLYKLARTQPETPYFHQPLKGKWHTITWKECLTQASSIAAGLKSRGIEPGSNIALLSKNCAQWIIADLAIWMAGCTSVPLYPTLDAPTLKHILEHSEAKAIFVGKLDTWKTQEPVVQDIPKIDFSFWPVEGCIHWDDLIKEHPDGLPNEPLRKPEELATIIYTSGTTGVPKGVMHDFKTFTEVGSRAPEVLNIDQTDRMLSYLPLSHVAERMFVQIGSLYAGCTIFFAESLETFSQNIKYTKPTIFLGVPRIWTKFQLGILAKKSNIMTLAKIPILGRIVRKKVKEGLGFTETKSFIAGAAPMPSSLLNWFNKLDIPIREAYAMSENLAYSHYNRHHKPSEKFGSVGQSLPGVDVKIDDEQQVCIKSIGNMVGYYKEKEKTAEALRDGYLLTGDQGKEDQDGFLRITGRIKDLFKTAKGKYIVPSSIEKQISAISCVEHVCITGAGLTQPVALVCLGEICDKMNNDEIAARFKEELSSINMGLASFERISTVYLTKTQWTINSGILTPTLKIKRPVVEKKYYELVYNNGEDVEVLKVSLR